MILRLFSYNVILFIYCISYFLIKTNLNHFCIIKKIFLKFGNRKSYSHSKVAKIGL